MVPLKPRERPIKKPRSREWSSGSNNTEEARQVRAEMYPLGLARGQPLVTLETLGQVEGQGWKLMRGKELNTWSNDHSLKRLDYREEERSTRSDN